jgi:hypothetical protein
MNLFEKSVKAKPDTENTRRLILSAAKLTTNEVPKLPLLRYVSKAEMILATPEMS